MLQIRNGIAVSWKRRLELLRPKRLVRPPKRRQQTSIKTKTLLPAVYSTGEKLALDKKSPTDVQTPPRLFRPATYCGYHFFSYSSSLRGCPTMFSRVDAGSLLSIPAHLRGLIAALKTRFTNSIRFLPMVVVLTNANSPRTSPLFSICSPVSCPLHLYIMRTPLALFHLHPLKSTYRLVECIRCSELTYRYRRETQCAFFVHSCRWSWCGRFFRSPALYSIYNNEPLT